MTYLISIFLLSIIIVLVYCSVKCGHRYIFDGADARAIWFILFSIMTILFYGTLILWILFNIRTVLFIYISQMYSMILGAMVFRSRLEGYTTVYIKKATKNIVYSVFSLIYIIIILMSLISFSPEIVNNNIFYIFNYNHFSTISVFNFLLPFFSICNFLLLIWFDISEKRKKALLFDFYFLIPIITITCHIMSGTNYFQFLKFVDFLYFIFPLKFFYKEYKSIIKHSDGIDVRVITIQDLIKNLCKECLKCKNLDPEHCVFVNKYKFAFKKTISILKEDEELRQIVLQKKLLNKNYNRIVSHIKAIVEN